MIPKLPILPTVFGAYSKVLSNSVTLIRATFLPMLALIIIGVIHDATPTSWVLSLVFWVMSLPFTALIAIACHRVILLGPGSLDNPWSMYWTKRESSFVVWLVIFAVFLTLAWWVFGVVFLMAPDSAFGYATPWLGTFLTAVTVTYLDGRFSMVLPAAAVGKQMFFSNSWYLTGGNGLRITVVLILPLAIFWGGFAMAERTFADDPSVTLITAAAIIGLITFAVEVAVLSLSYKFLRDAALRPDSG